MTDPSPTEAPSKPAIVDGRHPLHMAADKLDLGSRYTSAGQTVIQQIHLGIEGSLRSVPDGLTVVLVDLRPCVGAEAVAEDL
jgi:hypothetical protein